MEFVPQAVPVVPVSPGSSFARTPRSRVYRMLRPAEVRERTRLSSTHIHRLIAAGRFPPYHRIGARTCGLPEHELDAFLAERMAARAGLPPLGFRPQLPLWTFDFSKVPVECGIRLLLRHEVLHRAGFSKSTLRRLVPLRGFPAPISLGPRASRWVAHEVDLWVGVPPTPPPGSVAGPCAATARVSP